MARVDGDDGAGIREGAHDGHHALGLLFGRDGRMPGAGGLPSHVYDVRTRGNGFVDELPGGLPSHVYDVRTGIQHVQAVADCLLGVVELPAVREGVWRDVEDAHDARPHE